MKRFRTIIKSALKAPGNGAIQLVVADVAETHQPFQTYSEEFQFEIIFPILSMPYEAYQMADIQKLTRYIYIADEFMDETISLEERQDRWKRKIPVMVYILVSQLPFERRLSLLKKIREHDEQTYKDIDPIFGWIVFDDIAYLSDEETQTLIKEIFIGNLKLALKSCGSKAKEKILSNMSRRASDILIEEIHALGEVSNEDIDTSQLQILAVLFLLVRENKITSWRI